MTVDLETSMVVLDGLLALACLVVGLHHLGRLVSGRSSRVPAAAHAAMGLGMAAMFAPAADPVPQAGWVAVFAAVAVWSVTVAVRAGSPKGGPGHDAVAAVAMLFMLLVGHSHAGAAGHPADGHPAGGHGAGGHGADGHGADGHGAGGHSGQAADGPAALHPEHAAEPLAGLLLTAVALGLAAWFLVDVVRLLTRRASAVAGPPGAGRAVVVAPDRPVPVPHLVMSAAMAVMLIGAA